MTQDSVDDILARLKARVREYQEGQAAQHPAKREDFKGEMEKFISDFESEWHSTHKPQESREAMLSRVQARLARMARTVDAETDPAGYERYKQERSKYIEDVAAEWQARFGEPFMHGRVIQLEDGRKAVWRDKGSLGTSLSIFEKDDNDQQWETDVSQLLSLIKSMLEQDEGLPIRYHRRDMIDRINMLLAYKPEDKP